MARYSVIYDACVLYPAPLRDLLIQLATANLFRAKWTDKINEEWSAALIKARPEIAEKIARTIVLMNDAVPDSIVSGYKHLIQSVTLPDPDDRHVVAAAIHAKADAIVTFNLKDFPSHELAKYNLEAIHPDEFIQHQIDIDDARVVVAAQKCCSRLINPPKTGEEYLATLEAQSLPKTVAFLRKYVSIFCAFRGKAAAISNSTEVIDLTARRVAKNN